MMEVPEQRRPHVLFLIVAPCPPEVAGHLGEWLKVHQGMLNQEENWDQGSGTALDIRLYGTHFNGQWVSWWLLGHW